MKETVLIVCGEHSGDLLGAKLIQELRKIQNDLEFFGIAGEEMLKENVQTIANIEEMNVVGFTGIALKYKFLKNLARKLVEKAKKSNCQYAILIDYPGFNLRLAKMLKTEGIRVVFYVSPQIWAWKYNRVYTIKEVVDLMLVLFPFEKEIYDSHNIPCVYTGHPVIERMQAKLETEKPLQIIKSDCTICIMPGSRTGEIKRLLPIILETISKVHSYFRSKGKKVKFLLPNISKRDESFILTNVEKYKGREQIDIEYHFDRSARCIDISDMVILSSGTATLEVAFFEKPMVILYKASFITYILAEIILKSKVLGLVNILSGEIICKEFLQYKAKPNKVFEECISIIENDKYRETMVEKIKNVKNTLSKFKASEKAAKSIFHWKNS